MLSNLFQAYDVVLFVCGFLPNHASIKYVCQIKQIGFLNLSLDPLFSIVNDSQIVLTLSQNPPFFSPKIASTFCPHHPYNMG